MSFGPDEDDAPKAPKLPTLPDAPKAPPIFGLQQSPGKKKSGSTSAPTFLGAGMIPQNLGSKTLLGM